MESLRRLHIYLTAIAVLAMLYSGWVLLNRRGAVRRPGTPDRAQTARDAEWERNYGGTGLKILQFYGREGNGIEGDKSVICYGVLNAKSIRIEPPVDGVTVALNKCVE